MMKRARPLPQAGGEVNIVCCSARFDCTPQHGAPRAGGVLCG